jgi:hypothetical protein
MRQAGEKTANTLDAIRNFFGNVKAYSPGWFGAYAVATGGGAGALAYQHFRGQSKRKALEDAMALRQRREYMAHPSQIMAIGDPVRPGEEPVDLNDTGE